jgi:CheY-like chemotaxis protein/HPt (histidine-containing phosphotransfer) domain-containing protein
MTGDEKLVRKEIDRPLSIPEELSGMTFLVVDDEEYNRLLFKKIFDRWKVRCDMAGNGMDALEMLKEKKYDILFMDMLMPGIDGLRTARFIREEMKITSDRMPVILTSAAPPGEEWEKYKNSGIDAFILKPFTEEILLSSVLSFTGERGSLTSISDDHGSDINRGPAEKVDLKNLYHIAAGDSEFVRQMLESFIGTTVRGLNEMKEAALKGESGIVSDLSHKLQPPCRHLGAMELSNKLAEIEKSTRDNGSTADLQNDLDDILSEFAIVKKAIEDHLLKISRNP